MSDRGTRYQTGDIFELGGVGGNSPRYALRCATLHLPPAPIPHVGGCAALRGPVAPLRGSARAHTWPHTPIRIHPPPPTSAPLTGWDAIP